MIACAALFPFLADKCAEVAAFAVSPECRGNGQGDKLLGIFFLILISLSLSLFLGILAAAANSLSSYSFALLLTGKCRP